MSRRKTHCTDGGARAQPVPPRIPQVDFQDVSRVGGWGGKEKRRDGGRECVYKRDTSVSSICVERSVENMKTGVKTGVD